MKQGVILYYIVSPVHIHNLELIAGQMPTREFRCVYESGLPWFTSGQMNVLHFKSIALKDHHIPISLWSEEVCAIIFSTTQLRKVPVNLLQEALKRNIPTIAIEESIQIALNGGRINNYLLPVDHLLVASKIEREGMIAAGVPEQNVEVTGWPFYSGQVGRTTPERHRKSKIQFDLDAGRPVAALTLTALGDAGESPEVRRRQLSLAASGLPKNYQLVVKPHPIEPLESLEPFIRECAPRANVVPGNVPISDLLEATDVLLNRGASQVCFEALLREISVIILDTGIRTPFHGLIPDGLIVADASELRHALKKTTGEGDMMRLYKTFMTAHLPYTPELARKLTCARIAEIASQRREKQANGRQWFDLALCQAWLQHADETESILVHCQGNENQALAARSLSRLIRQRASLDDLATIRQIIGPGFYQALLQSLWIRQLATQRGKPPAREIEWVQDFPPTTNTSWFIPLTQQWAAVLIRSKESKALQAFTDRLEREFIHEPGIDVLVRHLQEYRHNLFGRVKYYLYRSSLCFREMSRPVRIMLIKLIGRRK